MNIRTLFDPQRDIHRNIEKVITFAAMKETQLRAEISEYVVTEKIEEQFRKLLDRMQLAMEAGSANEIGVWVSGFYGSGKSSFAKYLGLAFDNACKVDGTPFVKHLQDRLHGAQTKALLSSVTQRSPAAVVLLDLASEMLTGATMQDVATVLYVKVLKWAGFSDNIIVAEFERLLQQDGKFSQAEALVAEMVPGRAWKDIHNNPLMVSSIVPRIAHTIYPNLFPTPASFTSNEKGWMKSQDQQVKEMIDIARKKSGKENVIFIVDEVGQYVASRDNLILNLDGLAKNLKDIGGGKVWLISTAQQTLTEDDPRASLNSPQLYKLKDRFPIQIDLESSDIKEICYRRLLTKSPVGAEKLGTLFDQHGQTLRFNTKLQDAKYYEADFSRESFINLYPFLPAHFDILLHLLGALAKSTGGVGLRSAIKIIQDVLKGEGGAKAMADQPVGWLATTVTLYDELENDIRRAFPSVHQAVEKVQIRFPGSALHVGVAKSVAVLQILGNLPVTVQNVTSLMHPSVTVGSQAESVSKAVEEMIADAFVPLGEKDGALVFLSEKLRDIEQERVGLALRTADVKRISNNALKELFSPLPSAKLFETMTVTAGIAIQSGGTQVGLAGEQNAVQFVIGLSGAADYEAAKTRAVEDSRSRTSAKTVSFVATQTSELDDLAAEIYRSQQIASVHRIDANQEVRDYCAGQLERAKKLEIQLQAKLKQVLQAGSFVFKGETVAVGTLDTDLLAAAKKQLSSVAARVFERYSEAPVRVATDVAEKFLKAPTPASLTKELDPLGFVQLNAGNVSFKTDHKAMVSIRDFIDTHGTVDGKRLTEQFSSDPFGWSPDTLRYIVAAMLMAGEVKLKVSGREVTTVGQQAIDALKSNNAFKSVGVSLRHERPSNEFLAKAAERLTELTGDSVYPLEQDISKAAQKSFPRFQAEFSPLVERLAALGLAGQDRIASLKGTLEEVLLTDASDVTQRLGAPESQLHESLVWARDVKKVLDAGLEATLKDLRAHEQVLRELPDSGSPGELRKAHSDDFAAFNGRLGANDFHRHVSDFNSLLTRLKASVKATCVKVLAQQKMRVTEGLEELVRMPGWFRLSMDAQGAAINRVETLVGQTSEDLVGLKRLLARDYDISNTVSEIKRSIEMAVKEAPVPAPGPKLTRVVRVPGKLGSLPILDRLIDELKEIRAQGELHSEIDITFLTGE